MPELFQQNTSALLPTNNLFNNLKTANKFFSAKRQLFESTEIKNLFALYKEKNIQETQLNQLDKMKKMTVASIVNNLKVFNIPEFEARLKDTLKSNKQQIEAQIKKILSNEQLKSELDCLVSRQVQLLDVRKQLDEAFSEEKINEKQARKFKSFIDAEDDKFYSEPVNQLFQRDFQAILQRGITESDLPHIEELSQLDKTIRQQAEDKIADYYMQAAEAQIAKNSYVTSPMANAVMEKNIVNPAGLNNGIMFYENEMSALHTADTVDHIYELVLNGADPVKESQGLDSTPLAQHFGSRYVLQQELNRVHIGILGLQVQLDSKLAEQNLSQQFSEDKKQLKTDFNNQIETLIAEIEWQPQLKMELENHIQAMIEDTNQQKSKLKNDLENQIKESKKETKALTPESKNEINRQLERLNTEADGLKSELKNNEALIDAHIKAILLKDVYAPLSEYPDIAGKERFQQTWNNCKQEIEKLQQTPLTENCSGYHFLTQDLDQLAPLGAKTLKGVIKQFPEYKPLLQMQNDLLHNYRLVQGPPPIIPTTGLRSAVANSNHLVKAPDIFETPINEKQGSPLNVKFSTENQLIQSYNRTRLNNSAFFSASFQSKSRSESQKTSERTSRLNRSLFFSLNKASSDDFSAVKEKLSVRKIYYANP